MRRRGRTSTSSSPASSRCGRRQQRCRPPTGRNDPGAGREGEGQPDQSCVHHEDGSALSPPNVRRRAGAGRDANANVDETTPADPNRLFARRLREFLTATADVNFSARTINLTGGLGWHRVRGQGRQGEAVDVAGSGARRSGGDRRRPRRSRGVVEGDRAMNRRQALSLLASMPFAARLQAQTRFDGAASYRHRADAWAPPRAGRQSQVLGYDDRPGMRESLQKKCSDWVTAVRSIRTRSIRWPV